MKTITFFLDNILSRLYKTVSEKPLLTSFIYVSFFFIIIVSGYLPIGYDTNDDISMMLTSKGLGYFSKPSPLVTFSNVVYGQYLSFFSTAFPQINFYTVNNFMLLVISEIFIVYLVLKFNEKFGLKLMFLMANVFIIVVVFTKLQFTITCSLVFIAGMLGVLFGNIKNTKTILFFGIFLCLVAALIRFKQTIVILAFITPLIYLITKSYGNKLVLKIVLSIGAIFIISTSLFYYNTYTYKHTYKTEFLSSSKKMAILFYDYCALYRSNSSEKNAFMKKHSISENDLILFHNFFWIPKGYFNPDNISNEEVSKLQRSVKGPLLSPYESLKEIFNKFFILIITVIFLTALVVAHKRKQLIDHFDFCFAYLIYFILLSQAFNWYFKPMPFRVLFSLFICCFYLVFFILNYLSKGQDVTIFITKNQKKIIIGCVSLLTFFLLLKMTKGIYAEHNLFYGLNFLMLFIVVGLLMYDVFFRKNYTPSVVISSFLFLFSIYQIVYYKSGPWLQKNKLYSSEKKLDGLDSTINYFVYTSTLHLESIDPFDNFLSLSKYKLYPISITSNHPVVLNANPQFKNNFHAFLIEENSQMLINDEQLKALDFLKIYYKEHMNIALECTEVLNPKLNKKKIHTFKLRKAVQKF